MKVARPARQSARPAEVAVWQRLAELPERRLEYLEAVEEKAEKERKERDAMTWRQWMRHQIADMKARLRRGPAAPPWSARIGERVYKWHESNRRDGIWLDHVAELTKLPERDILRVTEGASFRQDFGRDSYGTHTMFFRVDFEKWIRAQARQAKAVAA